MTKMLKLWKDGYITLERVTQMVRNMITNFLTGSMETKMFKL